MKENRGENCHFSKFTEREIIAIKNRLMDGAKVEVLATVYGMSKAHMRRIKDGVIWGWLRTE